MNKHTRPLTPLPPTPVNSDIHVGNRFASLATDDDETDGIELNIYTSSIPSQYSTAPKHRSLANVASPIAHPSPPTVIVPTGGASLHDKASRKMRKRSKPTERRRLRRNRHGRRNKVNARVLKGRRVSVRQMQRRVKRKNLRFGMPLGGAIKYLHDIPFAPTLRTGPHDASPELIYNRVQTSLLCIPILIYIYIYIYIYNIYI